jgi:hypothetical protein
VLRENCGISERVSQATQRNGEQCGIGSFETRTGVTVMTDATVSTNPVARLTPTVTEARQAMTASSDSLLVWDSQGNRAYLMPSDSSAPTQQEQEKFRRLADTWREETFVSSSLTTLLTHPAYLRILAMGKRALPLILADLRDRGGYWFMALDYIVDEDANPITEDIRYTPKKMKEAWIEWGVQNHYL